MNYNDQILENKAFNFFKQLMYNIALSICIMLVGVLIMVYGFKFNLYEVLTPSEEPYLPTGCLAIVKEQDSYKVGDIINFQLGNKSVTHRLIGIVEEGGKTYYICHGDNNSQNANGEYIDDNSNYQDDIDYVAGLIAEGKTWAEIKEATASCQYPSESDIKGKVVDNIPNYGTYLNFMKSHYMLLIALVAGIWCISSTVQNEIDMRRSRRLM